MLLVLSEKWQLKKRERKIQSFERVGTRINDTLFQHEINEIVAVFQLSEPLTIRNVILKTE